MLHKFLIPSEKEELFFRKKLFLILCIAVQKLYKQFYRY